ncbi:amino acid ABC transporter membrane protein 1, PAAT family [Ralstonia sp. 25mfcol4.1]|uniref:amino acid ABC transporter permease n=1 Tax=Ralstonia sp. 25mfcol4.1 TaxID=1761899 RepID=UPI00042984DC|nr:amino acid ABC transporter permease [Ralstonia sp. 25mfcol4.1]SDP68148.1 amino acid ABC transporter membrane protein 1, PAAT family [Ralstonia sp. 25mfcol4.1]
MAYAFDFVSVLDYTDVLVKGIAVTAQLTLTGGVLGVAVAVAGAWAKTQGPAWLRAVVGTYVELIRNTPFLIQLFFIFFGLPSLGVHLPEMVAASLAMVINLGAYGTEIVRAGLAATPRGQFEAGASLAMSPFQVFRHVVLRPALQKIWPALSSQVVIVMLGSAVCSQIAAQDLTYAANFIQGRNFRAFEVYLVSTGIYLLLAIALRQLLRGIGRRLFVRRVG